MKLSAKQTERTANQIGAQPVPEDHPVVPQLTQIYGDHTFFLDKEGLDIVEAAEPKTASVPTGRVVKIASWADAQHTTLATHEPMQTDMVVQLGPEKPDLKA